MKVTTLILSFIFVVCVSGRIVQAEKTDEGGISVNIRHADGGSLGRVDGYEKKYSAVANQSGTSTPSLIVYNATVLLEADYDGDGYYRTVSYFFDIDTNSSSKVNYYVIVYLNMNDGYGWYTSDSLKSNMYTLENGYSPEEGLYYDLYFQTGYKKEALDIKIEVYYEDGKLACVFGPDDDSDLSQTPIEAAQYDVKKDPFIPSPNPSATPTPAPTADEIKLDDSVVNGDKLILRKGESINVSAEALSGGDAISGAEIKAEAIGAVNVSPSVATTDENGLAEFTITAKKKRGSAQIRFSSGDAKKILRMRVK